MAIPANTTKVVLAGHLTGGEIFETGFWLTGDAPVSDAAANVLAASLAASFTSDAAAALRAMIGSGEGYDEVRVYSYVSGGPSASFVGSASLTAPGTGTTYQGLNQACCVVTLLTGLAGRRNRGRMYLPATHVDIPSGAEFNPTQVDTIANAVGAWFTDINTAGPGPKVCVMSSAASAATPVLDVRVDNKPDIQRRRANKLAASHTKTVAL